MKPFVFSRCAPGFAAALFGLCPLAPSPARAQTFACTGAAGERQVGTTGGSHGLGVIPICVQDAPNPQQPTAPYAPPPRSTYGAVAWHRDAADVWMEGGWSEKGMAESRAIAACNRAMGGGCVGTGDWANSSMAVIRSADNRFYVAWLGEGRAELRTVLDKCSSEQMLPCEVYRTFDSSRPHYRPGPEARKIYGASAWNRNGDKLYIAGGAATRAEAEGQALSACRAANPSEACIVPASIGSGFIQVFLINHSTPYVVIENSPERAQLAAQRQCQQQNNVSDCQMQATFDSRKREQFVYDSRKGIRE